MVSPGEDRDFVATADGAGDANGGHDSLRAGTAEANALHPGQLPDQRRDFPGQWLYWADFKTAVELLLHRLHDERWTVPEQARTEAHHEIHILVAVHVPNLGSIRSRGDDRINHFLPELLKSGDGARVGKDGPVFCGQFPGARRTPGVRGGQRLQGPALLRGERSAAAPIDRLERPVSFDPGLRRCRNRRCRRQWRGSERWRRDGLPAHQLEQLAGEKLLLLEELFETRSDRRDNCRSHMRNGWWDRRCGGECIGRQRRIEVGRQSIQ